MSFITVTPPEVKVLNSIDTEKIEELLSRATTTQGDELPRIRASLEVLAGTRPKKLVELENAQSMLMDRYEEILEYYKPEEFGREPETEAILDKCNKRLDELEVQIAEEKNKFMFGGKK